MDLPILLSGSCLHRLRTLRLSSQINVLQDQRHLLFQPPQPSPSAVYLQLMPVKAEGCDSGLSSTTHTTGLSVGLPTQPACLPLSSHVTLYEVLNFSRSQWLHPSNENIYSARLIKV